MTLCDPMGCSPPGSSVQGDFPRKNTEMDCRFLLQGIFPPQGSNLHLLHWQVDSLLSSHLGSPFSAVSDSLRPHGLYSLRSSPVHVIFQARVLEWVAISFSRGSSKPRDWTWVFCIASRRVYCLSHQGSLTKEIQKFNVINFQSRRPEHLWPQGPGFPWMGLPCHLVAMWHGSLPTSIFIKRKSVFEEGKKYTVF